MQRKHRKKKAYVQIEMDILYNTQRAEAWKAHVAYSPKMLGKLVLKMKSIGLGSIDFPFIPPLFFHISLNCETATFPLSTLLVKVSSLIV